MERLSYQAHPHFEEGFRVRRDTMAIVAVLLALTLYSLFSDPTPDRPGVIEALIGICLVAFVGPVEGLRVVSGQALASHLSPVNLVRAVAFWYMLVVPLFLSALYGARATDIIRDVVPHLYMFMPVLATYTLARVNNLKLIEMLAYGIAFSGVVLAIRHLYTSGAAIGDLGSGFYSNKELYLSTDPTVLFASIFLPMRSAQLMGRLSFWRNMLGITMVVGGLVAMAALVMKGHRGPIGLMIAAYVAYLFLSGSNRRIGFLGLLSIFVFIGYIGAEKIEAALTLLIQKHERVGINARDLEFLAIWEAVRLTPWSVTFGLGWGSLFRDPAAGGGMVNFAHFTVSYGLLKGGVLGVAVFISYLATYIGNARRLFVMDRVLFLSIGPPLLVAAFLNGSFRFLTTGVLLCLLVLASKEVRNQLSRSGRGRLGKELGGTS